MVQYENNLQICDFVINFVDNLCYQCYINLCDAIAHVMQ